MHRLTALVGLLLAAPSIDAAESEMESGLFKCLHEDGRVVYQDRDCAAGQVASPITTNRTSTLPLQVPQEDLSEITRLLQKGAAERRREAARRDRAIRQIVQRHVEKRASCAHAREEYHKVLRFRRRHGYVNAKEESIWLGRMRDSCSD